MEDGDLWQAYNGDAIPSKEVEATDDDDNDTMIIEASSPQEADTKPERIRTSPPEECHEENNDAVTSTAAVANNPIITAQHAAQVVDVGPPVNIYAEAHRHANIATDRSESLNDDDGKHDVDVVDDVKVTRDGPHASLHLSNELKQQNKKKQQPEGNDTVTSEKRAAAGETGENEAAVTAEDANSDDDVQNNNDDAIDSAMDEVTDDVANSDLIGSVDDGADSIVDTVVTDQVATDQTDVITTDDSDVTKESEQPIDDDSATASISEEPSTDDSDVSTTTEPIKPLNRSRTVSEDEEEDDEEPKQKIQVDYASKLAGAQILEKSPTFKGASNLLTGDIDRYAIAPCDDKKYVVIGLSEDILVKEIKLSNFERYSSHVREFQVLASQEYPAPSAEYWNLIGTFEAHTRNGEQTFELEEPAWARYLKFKFRSHYGAEHYCTLSQIKVHGSTMLQGFHEQWIESEKELEQEKENQQQHQHQHQEEQGEEEEYNDDHQQQGEQEDVALAEKATEELTVGEEKGDEGGESDSLEQEQHVEPLEDTKEEDDIEGGADIVNDAPSYAENTDEELSSSGDDESSEDKNEEHTEQDEETTSGDQDASIPDEVPISDQEDVADVVTETAGDRVEPKEEKVDQEVHEVGDSDKSDQPSQPDDDDDMTQADSDGNAARDDDSAVVEGEEEIADSNPSATDTVKAEETISADSAVTNQNKTDTEEEASSEEGVNQDESLITETLEATNKTKSDITTTNPNSAPGDKVVDDATKTTSSKSVAIKKKEPEAIKKKEPEGENIPKGKDLPAKPIEKDATAKSSSPLTAEKNDNVKNAAMTSGELIAKISTRFPHASCIKDLDFHAFKSKTLLSNAGQLSQMTGPKMEPIFTKITNEIKSVQITQHQYEQYISAVKTCYEKLFLDMANDLDTIQRDYDRRLSNIEEVLSNVVPGGLSKSPNHRFMAVLPAVGVLFTSEYAQLMFSIGFTVLMIFLRMRCKKKNLGNPSPSLNSKEGTKTSTPPAKEAATTTPPATPMSLAAEVSPSSINNFEQHEEKEVHSPLNNSTSESSLIHELPVKEDDDVSGDKPPLVRIISNDEEENKSSVSIMSNNCSPPSMAQHHQIAKDLKVTC